MAIKSPTCSAVISWEEESVGKITQLSSDLLQSGLFPPPLLPWRKSRESINFLVTRWHYSLLSVSAKVNVRKVAHTKKENLESKFVKFSDFFF